MHIVDVAAAQILAMEEPKASGRFICSSSVAHWSEIIEMLKPKYPLYPFETKSMHYAYILYFTPTLYLTLARHVLMFCTNKTVSGAVVKKGEICLIAWTQERYMNLAFGPSNHYLRCSMTVSSVSKTRVYSETAIVTRKSK